MTTYSRDDGAYTYDSGDYTPSVLTRDVKLTHHKDGTVSLRLSPQTLTSMLGSAEYHELDLEQKFRTGRASIVQSRADDIVTADMCAAYVNLYSDIRKDLS